MGGVGSVGSVIGSRVIFGCVCVSWESFVECEAHPHTPPPHTASSPPPPPLASCRRKIFMLVTPRRGPGWRPWQGCRRGQYAQTRLPRSSAVEAGRHTSRGAGAGPLIASVGRRRCSPCLQGSAPCRVRRDMDRGVRAHVAQVGRIPPRSAGLMHVRQIALLECMPRVCPPSACPECACPQRVPHSPCLPRVRYVPRVRVGTPPVLTPGRTLDNPQASPILGVGRTNPPRVGGGGSEGDDEMLKHYSPLPRPQAWRSESTSNLLEHYSSGDFGHSLVESGQCWRSMVSIDHI